MKLTLREQIRAAEDVLSLTRVLKEAWLFGKLNTIGASEAEKKAEEYAIDVAERLRRFTQESRQDEEKRPQ